MNRFFVNEILNKCSTLYLRDENHKHIKVLRLNIGDIIVVFNGNGGEYKAELMNIFNKKTKIYIFEFLNLTRETKYFVHLLQSVTTSKKMDFIIKKSIELGVHKITPLITSRSNVSLNNEFFKKRKLRWKNIIISSCEQCGRNYIPKVLNFNKIFSWLKTIKKVNNNEEIRVLLDPHSNLSVLKLPIINPNKILVLIGPEGGFSNYEIKEIKKYNFLGVNLGNRILKVETVCISILSVFATLWGGW